MSNEVWIFPSVSLPHCLESEGLPASWALPASARITASRPPAIFKQGFIVLLLNRIARTIILPGRARFSAPPPTLLVHWLASERGATRPRARTGRLAAAARAP